LLWAVLPAFKRAVSADPAMPRMAPLTAGKLTPGPTFRTIVALEVI
jgi:hypothetical protein